MVFLVSDSFAHKTSSSQNAFTMSSLGPSSGRITPLQQMLASGSGALITSLLVTPLDVVKTRLQAQLKPIPKSPCYLFCNGLMDHLCLCANLGSPFRPFPHTPHPPFNSTLDAGLPVILETSKDALIKIPRYEGLSALWRGLPPTLVMAIPNTMIYFTLYDQLKVMYGFEEGQKNVWSPLLAGTTARTISITCISPIEMIRTKMQAKKQFGYKDLISVIKNAIQQGGVLSLWQGLGPTLLRDVPFSAVYWTGYELLRARFAEPGIMASFSSGVLSGAFKSLGLHHAYFVSVPDMRGGVSGQNQHKFAALITTPFDVVKTHRQMELGELVFKDASTVKKLPFTFSLMFQLYRESGWRSLFAGVSARVMKVAPACAVMISTYEYSKSFFRRYNMEKDASVAVSDTV